MEQRAKLAAKASPAPHVMYMTATPIPRTLALVEHGDLALYTINELPPGRSPVATRALADSPASRALVSLPNNFSQLYSIHQSLGIPQATFLLLDAALRAALHTNCPCCPMKTAPTSELMLLTDLALPGSPLRKPGLRLDGLTQMAA